MTVNLAVETGDDVRVVKPKTGYEFLIDTLATWHVRHYAGVTGGGVIHLLKHLEPMVLPDERAELPVFSILESTSRASFLWDTIWRAGKSVQPSQRREPQRGC
ncbi:hypothetical protein [Rhizobium sp. P28RR-XV]|uniref:hypothetical protein n=1 Tax=Rhizobium sp. P28RR-XV TaxID=2726737 RepID=UPI001FEF1119|nr:hypothetical protein [Rhizobium sp. P28RR-XV]